MRIEIIKPFLIFVALLFLQLKVIPIISLDGTVPDLILIFLTFYTLKSGRMWGLVAAGLCGLTFDFVSGSLIGSAMFSKTIAIFITGLFYKEQKSEFYIHSYFFALILLAASIIDALLYSLITNFDIYSHFFFLLFKQGILPGVYTAMVGLLFTVLYPKKGFR